MSRRSSSLPRFVSVAFVVALWAATSCVPQGPARTVVDVAAGPGHTCVVLADGTAQCWGNNYEGQLGTAYFAIGGTADTPVDVTGLVGATQIVTGQWHSCALLDTGRVSCWGANSFGQLGNATTTRSNVAVEVVGLTGVVEIDAFGYATCARTAEQTMWCWGAHGYGGLSPSSVPVQVGLSGVTDIAGTCALLGAGGTVSCWGSNNFGQLGNGTFDSSSLPVAVSGLVGATQISSSGDHVCAVVGDGAVQCWGFNRYGQLGNATTDEGTNVPVAVVGATDAVSISARGAHTCAVLADRSAVCWGENERGALGNGTTNNSGVPVPVSGLAAVSTLSAGGSPSCAVLDTGALRCWGWFTSSDWTGTVKTTPQPVAGFV